MIIPDVSLSFYQESIIGNKLQRISDFSIENTILGVKEKTKGRIIQEDLTIPLVEKVLTLGGIYEYKK